MAGSAFAAGPYEIRVQQFNPAGTVLSNRDLAIPSGNQAFFVYDKTANLPYFWNFGDGITFSSGTINIGLSQPVEDWVNDSLDALYIQTQDDLDAALSGFGDIVTYNASDFATTAQGALADSAVQPSDLTWSNITGKPSFATVATSGSYSDLSGTPSLATVATTGDYDDLSNLPTLFSGDYNDLTNKPTLFSGSYTDLTNIPSFADVAFSGDYNDLDNLPNLADVAYSGDYDDLDNLPNLADVATSGDYNDLINKPSSTVSYRARVQTDGSGNYTWTYPSSFASAPNVQATVEAPSGSVLYSVQLVGAPSTTQATFKVISSPTTSILGIVVVGQPVGAQAYINISATQQ